MRAPIVISRLDGGEPGRRPFDLPHTLIAPYRDGAFTAAVIAGAPINCDVVTCAPHGAGTHTETARHVIDAPLWISDVAPLRLLRCALITMPARQLGATDERGPRTGQPDDRVLTAADLHAALRALPATGTRGDTRDHPEALVIRWSGLDAPDDWRPLLDQPPYLTRECMHAVRAAGVDHLVVELPSVDRWADDGQLENHRTFWALPPRPPTHPAQPPRASLLPDGWLDSPAAARTITELAWVPRDVADGWWALRVDVPPWRTDAAPARLSLHDPGAWSDTRCG